MSLSAVGSSWVSYHSVPFHSDDDGVRADTVVPLCLQVAWICLDVVLGFLSTIRAILRWNLSAIFFLPYTSREVSDNAMGWKLLDDIAYSGHRNIKIYGDGLVALRLSVLFHNFASQILRQLFDLRSFLHAQCGIQRHRTQRLSQLFSLLTGCKCDLYMAST